ncbi:conjugal transfer protein TraD [Sphingomonas sp. OK281]|uniref:conjugal transfer protein TraD n=1 Tax=Sphingomonas sp. OK281 TaxID=1881067 RepID=UPI0008F3A7C6|nr:conjugal transfer protein TraD [Sphingomonas sp. OK281]SFO33445.1 Conjugal transfer protein TraD [Sphingomonas sp. OK281]
MRKPRDYDSDMKALRDRAQLLKTRKVQQLGELVIATGADVLPVEQLAGALLAAVDMEDAVTLKEWDERGEAFFQSKTRSTAPGNRDNMRGASPDGGSAKPTGGDAGTP